MPDESPTSTRNPFELLLAALWRRRRGLLGAYVAVLAIAVIPPISFATPYVSGEPIPSISISIRPSTSAAFYVVSVLLQFVLLYGGGRLVPRPSGRVGCWLAVHRRTAAGVRWTLPVLVFGILSGVLLAVAAISWLTLLVRLGGFGLDRDLAPGFLGEVEIMIVVAFGGGVIAMAAAIVGAIRPSRLRVLARMSGALAILGIYAAVLLGALAVVRSIAPELLTFDVTLYAGGCAFVLASSLGAPLRLLFLLPERLKKPLAELERPRPSSGAPIKAGPSLSSARGFATALLVVAYVTFDVAMDDVSQLAPLLRARQIYAAEVLAEPGSEDSFSVDGLGEVRIAVRKIPTLFFTENQRIIEVEPLGGGRWTAWPDDASTFSGSDARAGRLSDIGATIGLYSTDDSVEGLFVRIERQLSDRRPVTLPVVGLKVRAGSTTWVLGLVTLLLLVIIRHRVRRIFDDETLAVDLPWLILDGTSPVEIWVGQIWVTLLVLAPSIVHAGVTISLMVTMAAEGGVTTLAGDVVRAATMISAWGLSSWIAVCSAVDLLQLRELRRLRGGPR